MPTTKAAKKSLLQNRKRQKSNLKAKSEIKKVIKAARKFISQGNKEKANETVRSAIRLLDSAGQRGIIKKNNAARRKSRLMRAFNAL